MAIPTFQLAPDLPPVSRLCFGTMTMGEQNGSASSLRLLDAAFDAGVNFFDSAEMNTPAVSTVPPSLPFPSRDTFPSKNKRGASSQTCDVRYPVPQRRETNGRSEELLGRWLRACRAPRDSVVIATKFAEAWSGLHRPIPDTLGLTGSLPCTFYVPMFGETEYDPSYQYASVSMEEQLEALGRAIDAGKIRYIGLSNETPYGLMKFLQLSKDLQLRSKLLTVQNSYNLLCRNFDSGLAECCHHERIHLLAYSPMAMGILSGKYHSSDDCGPPDARMNLFKGRYSEGESRYKLQSPRVKGAVKEYTRIAAKHGISPAVLAIGTMTMGEQNGSASSLRLPRRRLRRRRQLLRLRRDEHPPPFPRLRRLGVDYIDLYQIHWPDRYVPMFGETEYDPSYQYASVSMEEQLEALGRAIDAGKIRYIGLSNETPYGLMKFLQLSKDLQLRSKLLTVQNSYNLPCRNFDSGLAECCHHERIHLLAY
ncbi:hypothetical protein PR202_gb13611 [Eleusine coracana subsp. coracana]|uniref:NADP-dependent oxidoreductase domain-containing protein n=1 Tax=Eleusine coracana subsp. coracana TaxID=191504 RepID=A0AAV5ETA4_ELECO|nr:hypothetical protein PR202_gb13611 [Eleusine coracana subsp. coracana]